MLRIYRVVEDGESVCVAAGNISEAILLRLKVFLAEGEQMADFHKEKFDLWQTTEMFFSDILEDVVFVGEPIDQEVDLC